MTGRSI